ncbi:MAG: GtrA family protein [bacterium]|nr:GtrA family protein [bacterium]
MDVRGLQRFARYATVGVLTLGMDLFIVYILVNVFAVYYLFAVATGFTIGLSTNYAVSRWWVFQETKRSLERGYAYFILAGLLSLAAILFLTALLVESFGIPLFPARIAVSGIVGFGNYLFNLYLNFKVAGKHKPQTEL